MEALLTCKRLIHKHQYKKAFEFLMNGIETNLFDSSETKLEALSLALEIINFSGQKNNLVEVSYLLASEYKTSLKYLDAGNLFYQLVEKAPNNLLATLLEEAWSCYSLAGSIDKSEECGLRLIEFLLNSHRYEKVIEFVSRFEVRAKLRNKIDVIVIKTLIKSCNQMKLENYIKVKRKLDSIDEDFKIPTDDIKEIIYLFEEMLPNWRESIVLLKFNLRMLFSLCMSERNNYEFRKLFIDVSLDQILQFPEEHIVYLYLARYAEEFKKKKIAKSMEDLTLGLKARNLIKRKHELILRKTLELSTDYPDEKEIESDFDLADDLFSDSVSAVELDAKEEIEQIKKDIQFLIESGQYERAKKLQKRIRELRGDQTLTNSNIAARLREEVKLKKEMEKSNITDTDEEISKWSSKQVDEEYLNISTLKKSIELLEDDVLEEIPYDIMICFLMLNIPEVSLSIIEKMKLKNVTAYEFIRHEHYRVLILMQLNLYHEALGIVEHILSSVGLVEDEKVEFVYLMGEILFQMNDLKGAYKYFKATHELRPGYRLCKIRITDIEQNK